MCALQGKVGGFLPNPSRRHHLINNSVKTWKLGQYCSQQESKITVPPSAEETENLYCRSIFSLGRWAAWFW
jgi:hypothetical protein